MQCLLPFRGLFSLTSWTARDASSLVKVNILSTICSSNNMLKTSDILFAALVTDNLTLATASHEWGNRTMTFSSRFYNEFIFIVIFIRLFNGNVIFFRIHLMILLCFRSISFWNIFFIKFALDIIRFSYIALQQYPKNVICDLLAGHYFKFVTFKTCKKRQVIIQICKNIIPSGGVSDPKCAFTFLLFHERILCKADYVCLS